MNDTAKKVNWKDAKLKDIKVGSRMSLKAYNELSQLYTTQSELKRLKKRYGKIEQCIKEYKMRSRDLKHLAEENEDEYEEYVAQCIIDGSEPTDIWSWIAEQVATAEEYQYEFERDQSIKDFSCHMKKD